MESKPERDKCESQCKLVSWYNEIDGTSKTVTKEEATYKGSGVEIFMFYASMLSTLVFCSLTLCKFQPKFLALLIPLAIWMFLRISRKDMKAAAYLIAGLFGGALVVILKQLFIK